MLRSNILAGILAGVGAPVVNPAIHNLKLSNTTIVRAAIRTALDGGVPVVGITHGNSESMGAGTGVSGTGFTVGAWPNSYHRLLAANISGAGGLQAVGESVIGNSYAPVSYTTYNTRVILGLNWTTAGFGPGGNLFYHANAILDAWDYFHVGNGEVLNVFYNEGNQTFNRPFEVLVNDVVIDTVTPAAGTETITIKTYNIGTLTNPKISIKPTTSGNTQFYGVEVLLNTQKIIFRGCSLFGAQAQDLSTKLNRLGAKIVHTEMQINDSNGNKAKATYKAQLITHIDSVIAGGSNITLGNQARSNTVYATNGELASLDDAIYELAALYDIPYIDSKEIYGQTYAIANALGYMRDSEHTTLIAKQLWAQAYGDMWRWLIANA